MASKRRYFPLSVLLLTIIARVKGDISTRYEIFPGCETWYSARDICIDRGGTLAEINDNTTQTHIEFLIKERHQLDHIDFWFNAHDTDEEGMWRTDDDKPLKFFNWAQGQPNNAGGGKRCGGNQHCAELSQDKDFRWKDEQCEILKGYICQYSQDNYTKKKKKKYKIGESTTEKGVNYGLPTAAARSDIDISSEVKIIETAERVVVVVLALSLVNLIVLIAMVFIFYTIVWRKMQAVIIQEPVYKDLVNQSATNQDNI
ncbi:regenerating islet-derived protein 4-like [Ptychodera flava]|uniref:regenerating islet-derived protein 4-like n=1 Tax=Ptychodera flava TaxID=63121 RepID=UPI00396AAE0E